MNREQAMAFAAIAKSKTKEEIKAFVMQLIADGDAIIRYDYLRDNIASMDQATLKGIYQRLETEAREKYPPNLIHEDPLFGKPMLLLRSKIGLFRGIKWDRFGEPRHTEDTRKKQIAAGRAKLVEMIGEQNTVAVLAASVPADQFGDKVKNVLSNIRYHEGHLNGTHETQGSILDFVFSDAPGASHLKRLPNHHKRAAILPEMPPLHPEDAAEHKCKHGKHHPIALALKIVSNDEPQIAAPSQAKEG